MVLVEKDYKSWAIVISAVSGLCGVLFTFFLKNKKATITHMENSWEELIDDSASFRDEIRKDLIQVKEERDRLKAALEDVESKMEQMVKENLELKIKEVELQYKIKNLENNSQ